MSDGRPEFFASSQRCMMLVHPVSLGVGGGALVCGCGGACPQRGLSSITAGKSPQQRRKTLRLVCSLLALLSATVLLVMMLWFSWLRSPPLGRVVEGLNSKVSGTRIGLGLGKKNGTAVPRVSTFCIQPAPKYQIPVICYAGDS